MYNFYSIYCKLCSEANIALTKAALEIGLSNAAPTGWKKGKVPNDGNMQKISTYFTEKLGRPITVSYLKGEEPEQEQIPDVAAFDGFAGESSDEIKNQVEALYVYRTLTPEEIELIKNYRKASQKNKNIVLTLLEES